MEDAEAASGHPDDIAGFSRRNSLAFAPMSLTLQIILTMCLCWHLPGFAT